MANQNFMKKHLVFCFEQNDFETSQLISNNSEVDILC